MDGGLVCFLVCAGLSSEVAGEHSGGGRPVSINDPKGKVTVSAVFPAGTQLKVLRQGRAVLDPNTGSIDYEETQVGILEVVETTDAASYCRIIAGQQFAVGDLVRE